MGFGNWGGPGGGLGNNAEGSGGGHGGRGGPSGRPYGATYGSVTNPISVGSGGGTDTGSAGGGAVKLLVGGTATIDGQISCNGTNTSGLAHKAGGAGGSIYISANTLAGGGLISVRGVYNAGGSGGGRIALYYQNKTFTGQILAYGGYGNGGALNHGAAGTIFEKGAADTYGNLTIDNFSGYTQAIHEVESAWTSLSDRDLVSYTFDNVYLKNGACLMISPSNSLTITGLNNLVVSGSKLCRLVNAGTFNCGSPTVSVWDRPYVYVDRGGAGITFGPALILSNSFVRHSDGGLLSNTAVTVANGSVFTVNGPAQVSALTVQSGCTVSQCWYTGTGYGPAYKLDLTVLNDLTLNAGAAISATACGFPNSQGAGRGWGSANGGPSGGYGGRGGKGAGTDGGWTYGSVTNPLEYGSGGCNDSDGPGGGGAIRLIVGGTAAIGGAILNDGSSIASYKGGGSGGAIYISAATVTGGGLIRAQGWSGSSGCGGGGRVAVYCNTYSFTGTNCAWGGYVATYDAGAAGTVYVKRPADAMGTAYIDNNNRIAFWSNWPAFCMSNTATYFPPMTNTPPPPSPTAAISNELIGAMVIVTNGARFELGAPYVVVGNIYLLSANAVLDLNYQTLEIRSRPHALGSGIVTNYGNIVWNPPEHGLLLMVR